MSANYDKLWNLIIDKHLSKTELTHLPGISTNAMAKLGHNEDIRVNVLEKLCTSLDCKLDDIVEFDSGGYTDMPYSADLYVHDLDRQAADALNQFPRFAKLLETYSANFDEKAAKIDFLSSSIRLGEDQMPEVYNLLPPICEQLGIETPELYYVNSKTANAATFGSVQPCIYLTSGLVHMLPTKLLSTVLAHECGHIACKHSLYHSIAAQVVDGIDRSPLTRIPAIGRYLTPTLVRALLFWDRCSALSADRAAALCDQSANNTVDVLLLLSGYGKNISRDAFLKQALDLKSFVNDAKSNKLMELMLVQDETHPRLATRAYECYEWSQSEQFSAILDGALPWWEKEVESDRVTEETVISGEVTAEAQDIDRLNAELSRVNRELERYTNRADKMDYALAVASGLIAGMVDSLFVGTFSLEYADQWGNKQAEKFVLHAAHAQGYRGERLAGAVKYLEDMFPIAADKATNTFGGGLQHHLRDFSHHPTAVGLLCSILTQFTGKVYGTDVTGAFLAAPLSKDGLSLVGKTFPEKISFGIVNWFFHLVSDIAGSSGSILYGSFGTGLPGPLISLLKEFSALPFFQRQNENGYRELSVYLSKLFNGSLLGTKDPTGKPIQRKFDLRTEMGAAMQISKQALPVIINESVVSAFFLLRQLQREMSKLLDPSSLSPINLDTLIPHRNRTLDQMRAIASITFTVADTADAAIRAAVESGGNWVLFSGRFVVRFNYVGAGHAALSIVREISNERKEAQLIHEKMLLSEEKAAIFLAQLQKFKEQLDLKVSNYLAENIAGFLSGFEDIRDGLNSGNSDLVIHGNVIIQEVLGRKPQFTDQAEFDTLMLSDTPLVL